MKKISIVILNFNGEKDTIECLKSIENINTDGFNLSVIVVDNASNQEFKVQSSEFRINQLKIIKNDKNLGFSGGNNIGIEYALVENSDYILLLNNDTIVDKNLVSESLKTIKSNSNIGIVAPKIYFAKGNEFHKDKYTENDKGKVIWYAGGIMDWKNVIGHHKGVDEVDRGQFDKTEKTEFASGCCMLIKKEVLQRIGLLDIRYFLYYEDSDFSIRAQRAGFSIIFEPKSILWHKNAGSTGGSGSKLQDYYISRNRMLFGMRYAPFKTKIALLRESFGLLKSGRKWQKRGIADFYLQRFGKGSFNDI